MKDNYFTNQNLSNNIDNSKYVFNQDNKSLNKTNNSSKDGSKNLEKSEESLGIEEVPYMNEEVDYLQKFRMENAINNPFKFNSHSNSLNSKSIPNLFNFSHSLGGNNNIGKANISKIPPPISRRTHGFIQGSKNNKIPIELGFFQKRNASGEKPPLKMQSKYSSASENKYNFIQRLNINPKFGMDYNNIPKMNYAPVNSNKIIKNNNNETKPVTYRHTSNYNTLTGVYPNSNHAQIPSSSTPPDKNYIPGVNPIPNKKFEERENRFKTTSNYSFNTISGTKLQDNIQLVKINQNEHNNKNINNDIVPNYNITGQNNNQLQYYQMNNNPALDGMNLNNYQNNQQRITNLNNPFPINNDINLANQRLTAGFKNLNERDKKVEKYQNPYYGTVTPQQMTQPPNQQINFNQPIRKAPPQNKNNPPEIAVVTKLTPDKKKLLMNKQNNLPNNNNNGINLVNNNNANSLGNNQTIEDIINQINRETMNNNKGNNYFIDDVNNTNNINNQMKGIPIQNNKNNMNNINNRINQPNNNQMINNQIVNKPNENQLINNQINNYLNQGLNYTNDNQYISPSAPIIPSQAQKLQNEYKTTDNQAFNTNNLNGYDNINDLININNTNNINDLNDNLNVLNNFGNNINPFNPIQNNNFNTNQINGYNQPESERLTIANEKPINDITNQPNQKANDVKVTYNDFDGSGFVKNYGGVSRPGKDSSGNRKINQDSLVCLTHINNVKDFNIFGVLDGHGPEGHFISHFAADFIPAQMANNPEIKALTDPEKIYKKFKENNCRIITQAYVAADNKLKTMDFDSSESGSTCCLIIHIGKHIICANTGDSRALVAYDESGDMNSKNLNYLKAVPLSIDYKPELPEESNRIMMAGGVVEQMKDDFGLPVGPYRVWARGQDYPGLAMSRSIGDLKGKTIGVIPDPGILEYDLNKSTKFVLACSDGVWEFLNNDTVRDIGKNFYIQNDASAYCHELIEQSLLEWTKNDIIVDDITAVVAFF